LCADRLQPENRHPGSPIIILFILRGANSLRADQLQPENYHPGSPHNDSVRLSSVPIAEALPLVSLSVLEVPDQRFSG